MRQLLNSFYNKGGFVVADNFYTYFKNNMEAMGLSAPKELFGTFEKSIGAAFAISKAVETYGTKVTIGELIGAGTIAEGLGTMVTVAAAYYLGAVLGSIAIATGQSLSGGSTIADVLYLAEKHKISRSWVPEFIANGWVVIP
jgi:hypothetical protein